MEYLIKQYPLESGALEIQYIEEYFGEFPRRKTAREIIDRLADRESLILMAEAPLPDDPGAIVPVSYKIVHETTRTRKRIRSCATWWSACVATSTFEGRRILYSWIGGTRRDWRGQGHFRALSEESESWAIAAGFDQIVVKTKNRYYDMRAVLAQLQFNVVKFERNEKDSAESKVYLAKPLPAELVRDHRSLPHRRARGLTLGSAESSWPARSPRPRSRGLTNCSSRPAPARTDADHRRPGSAGPIRSRRWPWPWRAAWRSTSWTS